LLDLVPGDGILVVAPHCDDETLVAGGTLARLASTGARVHVLVACCETLATDDGCCPADVRAAELNAACEVLGVADYRIAWKDVPQAANPGAYLTELITLIERGPGISLAACRPRLVIIPNGTAHHQHHRAVHDAALAAARPGGAGSRWVPSVVLGYDGPEDRSWLAAGASRPLAVDITGFARVKEKALRCYASQLRNAPHPRSPEKIAALDEAAGAVIGTLAAERFAVYRMAW
jgi:LmbE family N-acetylglucosaminyl deacetylase